ncbi:MAG: PCRF domain-containing protein, partial [candidate division Zixibacteria bacterium]|nr:PCRF domain-containing protein [candidate division Zixibacteria bacterium]
MLELVAKLEERLQALDKEMVNPETFSDRKKIIALNRERRRLESVLEVGRRYREALKTIEETREIIDTSRDEELVVMAREELAENEDSFAQIEREFKLKLLPSDPDDDKAAIVEIRAGTGGDEAGLFVHDLFRMYQRFADRKGWKQDVLNSHASGIGGFKEIIFSLEGELAYGLMKYESGVHRVQRVPATETQGRIHTSACTVAVLPEAEEVEVDIDK